MEKLPLYSERYGDTLKSTSNPDRRARSSTSTYLCQIGVIALLFIGYLVLLRPSSPCTGIARQTESYKAEAQEEYDNSLQLGLFDSGAQKTLEQTKIPLEAHIMSKCPDAQDCLQKLVLPAMEKISDKVDFKLSFIASVSKHSEEIECMHGPGECIGDMLMLCAANLPFPPTTDEASLPSQYPRTPIIRSLGFANCLINNFSRIPEREFVHQCAMEHGIDFEALNKCASQQNDDPNDGKDGGPPLSGLALLRESATRGEQLGIKTSCTVRLDDAVWCIRDSNEWKNCAQNGEGSQPSALADQVEKLWKERN
ncbi:Gamma interferon inducible lysosomal thiol reductase GILT [Penicillium cf. griseofulvum]|uniref:Gamma interferon inducible lysosomal thiol reductase GILT n=1 Tax=Penicillium cf. griseofulvum TaxID=2972120 RepID=A0A9W9MFM2_9EURO|nr:Gamma interferon inducible lysosomal thiol reductase GILT [Penicillium cf. griseofulvum]KAJ5423540.1 Gamma interferon inducible lysosomal thiol reductase GILT [Penicillium cf. griseofulvum]KAJ5431193.1 Gamma interferon inducible lysosomal thiol reductase GILT [Penicillium cf. griseofulvum]